MHRWQKGFRDTEYDDIPFSGEEDLEDAAESSSIDFDLRGEDSGSFGGLKPPVECLACCEEPSPGEDGGSGSSKPGS